MKNLDVNLFIIKLKKKKEEKEKKKAVKVNHQGNRKNIELLIVGV